MPSNRRKRRARNSDQALAALERRNRKKAHRVCRFRYECAEALKQIFSRDATPGHPDLCVALCFLTRNYSRRHFRGCIHSTQFVHLTKHWLSTHDDNTGLWPGIRDFFARL